MRRNDDDYGPSGRPPQPDKDLPLFPVGHETGSKPSDPPTSAAAFEWLNRSGLLGELQREALGAVRTYQGRTAQELDRLMRKDGQEDHVRLARRLSELERHGLIYQGPTRPDAHSGRQCVTWWPGRTGSYDPEVPAPKEQNTPSKEDTMPFEEEVAMKVLTIHGPAWETVLAHQCWLMDPLGEAEDFGWLKEIRSICSILKDKRLIRAVAVRAPTLGTTETCWRAV